MKLIPSSWCTGTTTAFAFFFFLLQPLLFASCSNFQTLLLGFMIKRVYLLKRRKQGWDQLHQAATTNATDATLAWRSKYLQYQLVWPKQSLIPCTFLTLHQVMITTPITNLLLGNAAAVITFTTLNKKQKKSLFYWYFKLLIINPLFFFISSPVSI